jgi:hypothetical protein
VQELKKQNIMIEELDGKMDTVTEKLETVNDKMKKTLEKVNTTNSTPQSFAKPQSFTISGVCCAYSYK